jgi:hypothetical protein
MTATMEQANANLKAAVKARLDATPADDPKMAGYSHSPTEGVSKPMPEKLLADVSEHPRRFYGSTGESQTPSETYSEWEPAFRGDSLLREPSAPGSREWLAALERLRALHIEKTAQYGGAEDAFENVTASSKCGVEPWRRALCDLSDCVVRMQKYAQGQPVDPTNALLDAANWALICLIKMEENSNGDR